MRIVQNPCKARLHTATDHSQKASFHFILVLGHCHRQTEPAVCACSEVQVYHAGVFRGFGVLSLFGMACPSECPFTSMDTPLAAPPHTTVTTLVVVVGCHCTKNNAWSARQRATRGSASQSQPQVGNNTCHEAC